MMASVSVAARESFFCSIASRAISQARSLAVRKLHLPATRTKLTPREAYSACSVCMRDARSTPSGRRAASVSSSSGPAAANSSASIKPSASGRGAAAMSTSSSSAATMRGLAYPIIDPVSPSFPFPLGRVVGRALAQIDRREGGMLMHLDQAFAHQLEGGREARRKNGGALRGFHHVADEELVEPAPVGRA